jgi:hypothetical protein
MQEPNRNNRRCQGDDTFRFFAPVSALIIASLSAGLWFCLIELGCKAYDAVANLAAPNFGPASETMTLPVKNAMLPVRVILQLRPDKAPQARPI